MKTVSEKREREKSLVSQMIAFCCRKRHGTRGTLCFIEIL